MHNSVTYSRIRLAYLRWNIQLRSFTLNQKEKMTVLFLSLLINSIHFLICKVNQKVIIKLQQIKSYRIIYTRRLLFQLFNFGFTLSRPQITRKVNSFQVNVPFSIPLENTRNLLVFLCFQGVYKKNFCLKWVKAYG